MPDIFKIPLNCFGLSDTPVMRCASFDTPIPFSIELENNFMAKIRLDEYIKNFFPIRISKNNFLLVSVCEKGNLNSNLTPCKRFYSCLTTI